MIIKKIIRKLQKIFKSSFFWEQQQQFPILIYDETNFELIEEYLPKKGYKVLNVRNKFNLRIIIKSLFIDKFNWNTHSYLDHAIKDINPRLIITTIDNSDYFWGLKKKFKKATTICIQNGYRDNYWDIFSKLKNKRKEKVDKIFVFSKEIGKIYSKFIRGQVIPIGSVYNNKTKFSKTNDKSIIFISQWFKYDPVSFKNNYQLYLDILSADRLAFLAVSKFAERNKIKLKVLGKKGLFKEKNATEEEQFFREINNNFEFLSENSNSRTYTYKKISDSYLVAGGDSTLLYESLSQGKKTIFLCFRYALLKNKSLIFGWPNKFKPNGPFWTDKVEFSSVEKIMKKVWEMNNRNWIKIAKKYSKKTMVYNFNNTLFQSHLNKVLNKII